MLGVFTVCSSEHSHETLWGVTVYSTGSPNRWRQDKFFGFKMSFGLLLSTIVDYFWKIKFFPNSFRDSETSTNITVTL